FNGLLHQLQFRNIGGCRFFYQYMFSCLCRPNGIIAMGLHIGQYENSIYLGVTEQFILRFIGLASKNISFFCPLLKCSVPKAHQLGTWQAIYGLRMQICNISRSNKSYSYIFHELAVEYFRLPFSAIALNSINDFRTPSAISVNGKFLNVPAILLWSKSQTKRLGGAPSVTESDTYSPIPKT